MDEINPPPAAPEDSAVIDLGDAAQLTKGNTSSSVEAKQTPYS
ncbi:albusnodin family lasso peptide [Actinacidiphila glaucinigra]